SLQAWTQGAPQATEAPYASTTKRPPTSERVIALLRIRALSRRPSRERRSEHGSRNHVQSRWSRQARRSGGEDVGRLRSAGDARRRRLVLWPAGWNRPRYVAMCRIPRERPPFDARA